MSSHNCGRALQNGLEQGEIDGRRMSLDGFEIIQEIGKKSLNFSAGVAQCLRVDPPMNQEVMV